MEQKRSKASVDYSPGHVNSRCGVCVHFIRGGTCELVRGKISEGYWCKLFKLDPQKREA